MKVKLNNEGYVESYAIIGGLSNSIETQDFEKEEDLAFFIKNYNAFKLEENKLVLDEAKLAEVTNHFNLEVLRLRRERECFKIINRGQPWYDMLTTEQRYDIATWYSAWLDVTETNFIPDKPEWLK